MSSQHESRRGFLKTGVALAGVVAASGEPISSAAATARQDGRVFFNVTEFGAKGDGISIDSAAINRAIHAAAGVGGGTVMVPAGTYLSYSIHLESRVSLSLQAGSVIVGADTPDDGSNAAYDLAEPNDKWDKYQDYGHSHFHNSLIWGENLDGVSIIGPGLIWGRGLSRGEGVGPVAETPGVANKAIALKNCRNVILRDFAILHGGHFGILATGVANLTIDNLTIDTQRDGIDVDCCRNVHISNCSVNSPWDDAICLKSSYALGYACATEMVTITNCYVTGAYEEGSMIAGTYKRFPDSVDVDRNGRIKLGTESNGGFKNITISNCVFDGCFGLAIISVDGAAIEDIAVSNLAMRDIIGAPIFIRLGSRLRGPTGTQVGAIRRVNISNIVSSETDGRACSLIVGVPGHAVEDIQISDIVVRHPGGGLEHDASIQLPEKGSDYPEPTMFGTTPAHGFFIRHVKGISMNRLKLQTNAVDRRPSFVLNDVQDAEFVQVKSPVAAGVPAFSMQDVESISILDSRPVPDTWLDKADIKQV